jgi:hypothetical protein
VQDGEAGDVTKLTATSRIGDEFIEILTLTIPAHNLLRALLA